MADEDDHVSIEEELQHGSVEEELMEEVEGEAEGEDALEAEEAEVEDAQAEKDTLAQEAAVNAGEINVSSFTELNLSDAMIEGAQTAWKTFISSASSREAAGASATPQNPLFPSRRIFVPPAAMESMPSTQQGVQQLWPPTPATPPPRVRIIFLDGLTPDAVRSDSSSVSLASAFTCDLDAPLGLPLVRRSPVHSRARVDYPYRWPIKCGEPTSVEFRQHYCATSANAMQGWQRTDVVTEHRRWSRWQRTDDVTEHRGWTAPQHAEVLHGPGKSAPSQPASLTTVATPVRQRRGIPCESEDMPPLPEVLMTSPLISRTQTMAMPTAAAEGAV